MNRQEQAMRLLRALNDVDDRYVAEASEVRKVVRLSTVARFAMAAAACAALVFAGTRILIPTRTAEPNGGEIVADGSPIQEVASLEEAESIVGFSLTVPQAEAPYDQMTVSVLFGEEIEVDYCTEDGADVGLYIRKAEGSEDVSGDYSDYSETSVQTTADGREVTLKGNDGLCSLAIWTDGGYAYAIGAQDHPITQEEMLALVSQTR